MKTFRIKDLINHFPKFKRGNRIYFTDGNNRNCCPVIVDVKDGKYVFFFTGHFDKNQNKYVHYKRDVNLAAIHEKSFEAVHSRYKLGDGIEGRKNYIIKEI